MLDAALVDLGDLVGKFCADLLVMTLGGSHHLMISAPPYQSVPITRAISQR
jgi:hypothetical protein